MELGAVANPLCSVITATWNRPQLLDHCLASVHAQDYRPLEHIVVSDGPDALAAQQVQASAALSAADDYQLSYDELPRHMTTHQTGTGADAFRRGCDLAQGAFLFFLPDDDLLVPHAISHLVAACQPDSPSACADFSYSQVAMHHADQPMTLESDWICGEDPPQLSKITNFLFRRELLELGPYPDDPVCPDWLIIDRWLRAGKRWTFVPEVLQIHHYDPHV